MECVETGLANICKSCEARANVGQQVHKVVVMKVTTQLILFICFCLVFLLSNIWESDTLLDLSCISLIIS